MIININSYKIIKNKVRNSKIHRLQVDHRFFTGPENHRCNKEDAMSKLSNLLKNNNEHAPTNHSVSMWRTRTQALSILPKNIKLI